MAKLTKQPVSFQLSRNSDQQYLGIAKKLLGIADGITTGQAYRKILSDGTQILIRKTNGNKLLCSIISEEEEDECIIAPQGLCIALESEYQRQHSFDPEDPPQYFYLLYNNEEGRFEEAEYIYTDMKGLPYITDFDYQTSEEQQPGVPNEVTSGEPCGVTKLTISTVKEYWIDEFMPIQQNFFNFDHTSNYVLDDEIYYIKEMSLCNGCDVACSTDDWECLIRQRTYNHYYVDAYKLFADGVSIFKGLGLSQIIMKPWFYKPDGFIDLTILVIKRDHSGDAPFLLYKTVLNNYPIPDSTDNAFYPIENNTINEIGQVSFDESSLSQYVSADTSSNYTTSWMNDEGTSGYAVITAQHFHADEGYGIVKYRSPYLFSVNIGFNNENELNEFTVQQESMGGTVNFFATNLNSVKNTFSSDDDVVFGACEFKYNSRINRCEDDDERPPNECNLTCSMAYPIHIKGDGGYNDLTSKRTYDEHLTSTGINQVFIMHIIPGPYKEPEKIERNLIMAPVYTYIDADSSNVKFLNTDYTQYFDLSGLPTVSVTESYESVTSNADSHVNISATNTLSIGNYSFNDKFTLIQIANAKYDSYVDYHGQLPWDVLDPPASSTRDTSLDMDLSFNATGTRILYVDLKNNILLVEAVTYSKTVTYRKEVNYEDNIITDNTKTRNTTWSLKSELKLYSSYGINTIRTRIYSNSEFLSEPGTSNNVSMGAIHDTVVTGTYNAPGGNHNQAEQTIEDVGGCTHDDFYGSSDSTDYDTKQNDGNYLPSVPFTFAITFGGFGWPFQSAEPLYDAWSPDRMGSALQHTYKSAYAYKLQISADKDGNFLMLIRTQAEGTYLNENIIIFNGNEISEDGDIAKNIPDFFEIHTSFVT